MLKAQHLFPCLLLNWPSCAIAQAQHAQLSSALSQLLDARDSGSMGCMSASDQEIVVCARPKPRYRIDPDVLAAMRIAEAIPPRPPVDANSPIACVGPNCGGGTIPLVGVALTAVKAAVLAAGGNDWRDAFRTHPDQYQAFEKSKTGKNSIGVSAGDGRH